MKPARARYAGPAAVAVLWSTLGIASLHSGFPLLGRRPLSWLVTDPAASVLFSTGLVAGALLMVAFHRHLRACHRVGRGFSLAMLGGLAGQVIAALVPIDGGPAAHRVHTLAALTLGASLPALMWRFAAAQPGGPGRRSAYRLFCAEAAACAAGFALSRLSVAPLAEILPTAVFHLWVLVLTARAAGLSTGRKVRPGLAPSWAWAGAPRSWAPAPAPSRASAGG